MRCFQTSVPCPSKIDGFYPCRIGMQWVVGETPVADKDKTSPGYNWLRDGSQKNEKFRILLVEIWFTKENEV